MSNFDKTVEIIGELATEYGQPGGDELFGLDEDAALALKEDGLLAPDVQIIRTTEELEALDPDSLLIADGVSAHDPRTSLYWNRFAGLNYLPAAVIATGEQVRAAREEMEKDNE